MHEERAHVQEGFLVASVCLGRGLLLGQEAAVLGREVLLLVEQLDHLRGRPERDDLTVSVIVGDLVAHVEFIVL